MDQQTRNLLQNATQRARRLLEAEITEQLGGTFDILPDGQLADKPGPHLSPEQKLIRRRLVEAVRHRAGDSKDKAKLAEAVADQIREAAFTILNRFVALKMLEARGLVQQCVSKGDQSSGFREFCLLAPGLSALPDKGYRLYLECVFDELSIEVKVLFDRHDPASLIWPRRQVLDKLLTILNDADLSDVWGVDETIGWVYQYFNSQEERRQMRDESSAPRNSRELAVRNQFFTPRYVVQFLTENTLGRIWYEMRKGQTQLAQQCEYLVRRPNEVFLAEDQSAPEPAADQADLSQEELLRQPIYIPHRPKKDPRDIRILDPACGSGHFLLYCFDLLVTIYEEAWSDPDSPVAKDVLGPNGKSPAQTLRADFPTDAEFRSAIPGLILQHNLHGMDIDARCAQIATMALWLRVQRAWHQTGVKPADRPRISHSNLVCAEPMPGEKELLREFVEQQFPEGERPAFAFLLEKTFDRMTLAGEAGSLLRIEEEIRTAIAEARALAYSQSAPRQARLFSGDQRPEQAEFDLRGLNDEQFWQAAEQRIYDALKAYAEQAENGGGFQRRLFADDAAQGFAFIDLCRKRYDVVVMNPPFGDPTAILLAYLDVNYAQTKYDLAAAFIERCLILGLEGGNLGWISPRTWFSSSLLESFRRTLLYDRHRVALVMDLGIGVLDSALVETAACTASFCESRRQSATVFRLLASRDKQNDARQKITEQECSLISFSKVAALPRAAFGYWFPLDFYGTLAQTPSFEPALGTAKQGLATTDDFRFLRCLWEVPAVSVGWNQRWVPFAKGGEYEPYYDDLHLVIEWENDGAVLKEYLVGQKGQSHWSRRIASAEFYGNAGLTYPERTTSDFSLRPLPKGAIFSATGQAVFLPNEEQMLAYLGLSYTRVFKQMVELFVGAGDASESGSAARHYTSGLLNEMPVPHLTWNESVSIPCLVRELIDIRRQEASGDEVTINFLASPLDPKATSFRGAINSAKQGYAKGCRRSLIAAKRLDEWACGLYGLTPKLADDFLTAEVCRFPTDYPSGDECVLEGIPINDVGRLVANLCQARGYRRAFTKKSYWSNRVLELICHIFERNPSSVPNAYADITIVSRHLADPPIDFISYIVGCVFGRWDIRYAMGERPVPELPDPFAPLPVCPPGMLQGDDGLPLSSDAGRRLRTEGRYPLDVAWDGILVDDPEHPLDLERCVHAALAVLWGERADAMELEAYALLGVPTLREWFRRPVGFFTDHLRRYSKSRRQAPIYWPLATPNASYSVWLYSHRVTADTLFRVQKLIEEKLEHEERTLAMLKQSAGLNPTASQRKEIEAAEDFVAELATILDEVKRVAPLWNPDLNDGTVLVLAPLWRLFPQHRAWQNELKSRWEGLYAGEYDWAHVAMHLWPERVVPKCQADRSLAIAHGLEDVFWQDTQAGATEEVEADSGAANEPEADLYGDGEEEAKPKKRPRRPGGKQRWVPKQVDPKVVAKLIADRTKPAVKAALKSLLEAPTPGGKSPRKKAPAKSSRKKKDEQEGLF